MKTKQKHLHQDRAFDIGAIIILLVLCVIAVAPLLLVVSASFTSESELVKNGYTFFPKKVSLAAYQYLIRQWGMIGHAYFITIFVTLVGTSVGVFLTMLMAYSLSRKDYRYRNVFTFIVFFTLMFNGGFVPSYMVWSKLFHVKDTILALILPNFLMNGMNVILVKNYFENSVPVDLIEAAKIDGASEMTIFLRLMLPLSKPVLTTIALFQGVAYWNDWTNGLYYIKNEKLYSIQNLLNRLLSNINYMKSGNAFGAMGSEAAMNMPTTSIRMAIAVIAIIPVMCIFPFIQKSLVKGVVMGAVKG